MKQSIINSYLSQTIGLLAGLLISLSTTECSCKKIKLPTNQYGSLALEVFPTSLLGDVKTTKATFTLATGSKIVDLKHYQAKINLLEEQGGHGSTISYLDGTQSPNSITTFLQKDIAHFATTTHLKTAEAPLEVPFTIIPGPEVTTLIIQFELLDQKGQVVQTYTVNWTKDPADVAALMISKLVYDPLSQMVIYKIQNSGQKVANNVQLRYTNISEEEVGKTVLLAGKETNVLSLGDISGDMSGESSKRDYHLVLDFKAATQATFKFELLCQDILIGRATRQEEFSTQVPEIELILDNADLFGTNRQATCKLKQKSHQPIDFTKLRLEVHKPIENSAKLLYNRSAVTKLSGAEIDLNNHLTFDIEPDTATQVSFTLQLIYGNTIIKHQTLNWQAQLNPSTQALFEAISRNELTTINQLLTEPDIQVNATNDQGHTPLHEAAKNGNEAIIASLLANGAHINAPTTDFMEKYTALHLATLHNNVGAVKTLLVNGADVNARTGLNQETVLHIAAQKSSQTLFKSLLTTSGIDVNALNNRGETPLYNAIRAGNQAAIQALLEATKINVNALSTDRESPLYVAVQQGNQAAVELLLDHGANINSRNSIPFNHTALHQAILDNHKTIIRTLLDKNANVNDSDEFGDTPLHYAASRSHTSPVEELLKNPTIDINAQNKQGETPLHTAVRFKRVEIIKLLLEKGAQKNIKNTEGRTPVALAKDSGDITIKKLFSLPLS